MNQPDHLFHNRGGKKTRYTVSPHPDFVTLTQLAIEEGLSLDRVRRFSQIVGLRAVMFTIGPAVVIPRHLIPTVRRVLTAPTHRKACELAQQIPPQSRNISDHARKPAKKPAAKPVSKTAAPERLGVAAPDAPAVQPPKASKTATTK